MYSGPFYGQDYEKPKWPGASYQSPFALQNMFREIVFIVICNLNNFDDLTENDFWVIQKITFANWYKSILDKIILQVSPDPFFDSGNCGKEGKHYKKLNISRTK